MATSMHTVSFAATHLAVAVLTAATGLACLHGMQVRRLKSKSPGSCLGPSLASIDRAVRVLVAAGVMLLAGLLAGGGAPPMLVGVSLFLFTVYLVARVGGAWHRPRHTVWLLLGAACLVSTCVSSIIPHLVVR